MEVACSCVRGPGKKDGLVVIRTNPISVSGQTPQLSLPVDINHSCAIWKKSCPGSSRAIRTFTSGKVLRIKLFLLALLHHFGSDRSTGGRKHWQAGRTNPNIELWLRPFLRLEDELVNSGPESEA